MITHRKGSLIMMTEGSGDESYAVILRVLQDMDLSVVDHLTGVIPKAKTMTDFVTALIEMGFVEDLQYSLIDTGPLDHINLQSIASQARRNAQ